MSIQINKKRIKFKVWLSNKPNLPDVDENKHLITCHEQQISNRQKTTCHSLNFKHIQLLFFFLFLEIYVRINNFIVNVVKLHLKQNFS